MLLIKIFGKILVSYIIFYTFVLAMMSLIIAVFMRISLLNFLF